MWFWFIIGVVLIPRKKYLRMWDNTRETHEKQHNVLNETHHLCKLQKVKEDIKRSLDIIKVKNVCILYFV